MSKKIDVHPGNVFYDCSHVGWPTTIICVSECEKTKKQLIACQKFYKTEMFTVLASEFFKNIEYKDVHRFNDKSGPRFVADKSNEGDLEINTEIKDLEQSLNAEQFSHKRTREDFSELKKWVMKTSNCKTCGGNSDKTYGLNNCKECGLAGSCPWPG